MKVIDSHTEGEPTRVVISGGPDLGDISMAGKLKLLAEQHDYFRKSVILEPRGSDVMVGALLCPPVKKACSAGVIFFNNTGYLGMCGHGALGVAITLKHLGWVESSAITIETPVGEVAISYQGPNQASVQNVASYLYQADVQLFVDGLGVIKGDVAWGGNWFFLIDHAPKPLVLANTNELTVLAKAVKKALLENGITGHDGAEIDHIEFFSSALNSDANSRNFVLCPGGVYDRSPCGTGTSAKIACLAAKGLLAPGEVWVQESVIGSRFYASYQLNEYDQIIPTIAGRAFISGETSLLFHQQDPFKHGINIV